ncbi:hypothetical protein ACFSGI_08805 [Paenibacillus nicotianae]|uniref:Uncharacterized protein n=1 Tax=Paenibacillus nicotianae TaxID=1526551 RepID=A0ABW4UUZ0_9BACL
MKTGERLIRTMFTDAMPIPKREFTHEFFSSLSDINIKCGCGRNAHYAVYKHEEPHCLDCMLEAVDNACLIPVRTLHTWEQYPTPSKGSASYLMYAYHKKGRSLPRKKIQRYGCRV